MAYKSDEKRFRERYPRAVVVRDYPPEGVRFLVFRDNAEEEWIGEGATRHRAFADALRRVDAQP